MKAIWNDQVIAEANKADLIYIEQNWYFPPDSVNQEFLQKSTNALHLSMEGCLPVF